MSDYYLSLDSTITELPYVGPAQSAKLERLGIATIRDILYHFPVKYRDTSNYISISQAIEDKEGMVQAKVESIKATYTRNGLVITRATITDGKSKANVVWFNQRYIVNNIQANKEYLFELKLPDKPKAKDFYCKDYEQIHVEGQSHLGRITPFYDQTAGVSSKWIRARLNYLEDKLDCVVTDHLPNEIRESEGLIDLSHAIKQIHFPKSFEEIEVARKRLGFDEMLELAIKLEMKKRTQKNKQASKIILSAKAKQDFISSLRFELTNDQVTSLNEVLDDISASQPMHRLLNGDVGSGKTVIAAAAAYAAAKNHLSTLIMAPTTILAQQHYRSFQELLEPFGIKIQLLISGEILEPTLNDQVIIGTHALLYENYIPEDIGLVIVDEQHRFGVVQREQLRKSNNKNIFPHYLTMTATPIPRTLTSIIYGDMDVSIIKELPKHRKPIESFVVPNNKSMQCMEWINDRIVKSNLIEQAYIVFPLVEESEKSDLKAATQAYEEFSEGVFKDLKIGLLHGRMKDKDKDKILTNFKEKKYNILISTTVIEVGIDVPDATIMAVENAERFGLAQLHQLRGRVGRGALGSYCYVIPGKEVSEESDAYNRLVYFAEHSSGFDVAEYDLKKRGPGEVYGARQSGIPEFKVADISDLELLSRARAIAKTLIK